MNGRCEPSELASGQKNRNLAQLFVKDVLFGILGGIIASLCPSLAMSMLPLQAAAGDRMRTNEPTN